MITDKLENLKNYLCLYPQLEELINYLKSNELILLKENLKVGEINLIPIVSQLNDDIDLELLEAHRKLIDLHITLQGTDKIAYQHIDDELSITKEYDEEHDYLLAKGKNINTLEVPSGYFCIIPNHFAHMALFNNKNTVIKVVAKLVAVDEK